MQTTPRSDAAEGAGPVPAPIRGPAPEGRLGRTRRGIGRAVLVAVLAVAIVVGGGIGLFLRGGSPAPAPASNPVDPNALAGAPALPSDSLSQAILGLQSKLKTDPNDTTSWASLGFAYVQEARVTADPSYYPKAEGALQRSLALKPKGNFEALAGLGALANARHDFAGAITYGRQAESINPYNANIKAIVGDGLIELGRYQEGFAELQKMIDLRPDTGTYARVSYARELEGDVKGATDVMTLALQSAGTPSDTAFADYYLGELAFNQGDLDGAESYYRHGMAADPSYVPPFQGLAKVEAARGDVPQALKDYQAVVDRYPLPQYVLDYGDLATAGGDTSLAEQQYHLFHVEDQLFAANGVDTNLEVAQFAADHGVDLAAGLTAAQAEWQLRQSVQVADTLAWTLYANGRFEEALPYAKKALALGTKSALFRFHLGMIEKALGQTKAARADLASALAINPHFSPLWTPVAASTLASLGGAP